MYLAHVCAAVASARGERIEQVASATTAAAEAFFGSTIR
jgi:Tat protein secretion system quality control protein TatD with DNase activity